MTATDDILSMSEGDLLARKNSITKDKLLDAVIFLKKNADETASPRLLLNLNHLKKDWEMLRRGSRCWNGREGRVQTITMIQRSG